MQTLVRQGQNQLSSFDMRRAPIVGETLLSGLCQKQRGTVVQLRIPQKLVRQTFDTKAKLYTVHKRKIHRNNSSLVLHQVFCSTLFIYK